jgi:Bacterial pre-peptidase C-terminal domain
VIKGYLLATILILGAASARSAIAQSFYQPGILVNGRVDDILSDRDIPTGQKGFAKDYKIEVMADDRLEIVVSSSAFDTVVTLLNQAGSAIAENDDGAVGTDSLLFVKIPKSGSYVVRVQSFGGSRGGKFSLTVTRLQPIPFNPFGDFPQNSLQKSPQNPQIKPQEKSPGKL